MLSALAQYWKSSSLSWYAVDCGGTTTCPKYSDALPGATSPVQQCSCTDGYKNVTVYIREYLDTCLRR